MKKYKRIWGTNMDFCHFWHQFGFWDRFGFFSSKFSKKDHFQKVNIEKYY